IALNCLSSLELLSGACSGLREHCIEGLQPDEARIGRHLEESLMLVTALTPVLGYDQACAIASHAHGQGLSLRESAVLLGAISAEDFDRCVHPQSMI
ncbi:MAG: class II fumarate hydratase, partial [Cyanobium sp.]